MSDPSDKPLWQASASFELIKLRADTLRTIRAFFETKNVLEVDTPILSHASITDPFIESFQTRYLPLTKKIHTENFYLHTSPEFPMKRLLASGIGSIFQIAKVFRQGEIGHKHNPEFTLLEWYRLDWDHHQLMKEVEQLLSSLLLPYIDLAETHFLSYKHAFINTLGINPHTAQRKELLACLNQAGLAAVLDENESKDRYLELLFSHVIEPTLGIAENGQACLCFLYHYPASQASLARLGKDEGQIVAERFEVFINGMELGNGFHELNNAQEQRQRFVQDNKIRKKLGYSQIPIDEYFLTSVDALPDCAGVAIGMERLLMVMSQSKHIDEVLVFPFERA